MITVVFDRAVIPFFIGILSESFHSQVGSVIVIFVRVLTLTYSAFFFENR